jgi:hypothetical protein
VSDSITTSVEVKVSPMVAFDVFTREIDAWYRVDSDTLPDITRTGAIRFESHLGGRLLDVHDLATGAGRELGRITAWEPGSRFTFTDNEGSEIEVIFEPCEAGTRVTLTHRGLDRLSPHRARALRRSGWAALAPFYRDHLAPNVRPFAMAVGFQVLLLLVMVGGMWVALTLAHGQLPLSVTVSLGLLLAMAAAFVLFGVQARLARRWLSSQWQFQRISLRLFTLVCLAVLLDGLYHTIRYGHDGVIGMWAPLLMLVILWCGEQHGPSRGQSLRQRYERGGSFTERHRGVRLAGLLGAVGAVGIGGPLALGSIYGQLADFVIPAALALAAAFSLRAAINKRREKQTWGFDPDLYLAVARPVSDENKPPQLLVHSPSKQPEYSGWYAYASDSDDEPSDDLVVWSIRDLVDHSPEAARPLREGHGKWRWDRTQRAYQRIDHQSENPQPA